MDQWPRWFLPSPSERPRHSEFMALAVPPVEPPSSRGQRLASLRGWVPWVSKGSLALGDQSLFAGSNFLLNVLLARWLAPADYGVFALAYSAFLILLVFHTALFTGPMMVFGSGKYRTRFSVYLGILLQGHLLLTLLGAALLSIAAVLLGWLYSPAVERALLAMAVAGPFILLLWLLRRALYARLNLGWSAAGGLVYLSVLLSCALVLHAVGRLSPVTGFVAMAVASLVACLLLLVVLRPTLGRDISAIRAVATDHWRYGRWLAAAAGPAWVRDNIYFLVLPLWVGLGAAGALKALLTLAMPATQAISALSVLLLAILVRDRDRGGSAAMKRTMRLALGLFLLGSISYLALIWVFRLRIFHLLYANNYAEYAGWPLLLAGLVPLAESLPNVAGDALGALERPDLGFWGSIGSGGVALALGVPLTWRLGVPGALVGLVASYVLMGALTLFFFMRLVSHERSQQGREQRHSRDSSTSGGRLMKMPSVARSPE